MQNICKLSVVVLIFTIASTSCGRSNSGTDQIGESTKPASGFALEAVDTSLESFPGGSATFRVKLIRAESFTDSIALSGRTLPLGLEATQTVIPVSESEGVVMIDIDSTFLAEQTSPFEVVASGGGIEHTAAVTLTTRQGFQFATSPITVEIEQGKNAATTITIERSGGFEHPVSLSLSPGTSDLTMEPVAIAAGSNQTTIILRSNAETYGQTQVTLVGTWKAVARHVLLDIATKPAPGSFDRFFGDGGVAFLRPGAPCALDEIGRVVLLSGNSIFRYTADGTLDTSFAENGEYPHYGGDRGSAGSEILTTGPLGAIDLSHAVSNFGNGGPLEYWFRVIRLNAQGLPQGFNGSGSLSERLPSPSDVNLVSQYSSASGKLLVTTISTKGEESAFLYDQFGRDSSFGTDGFLDVTTVKGGQRHFVDESDQIVSVGITGSIISDTVKQVTVVAQRIKKSGEIDDSFGEAGTFTHAVWTAAKSSALSINILKSKTGFLFGGVVEKMLPQEKETLFVCSLNEAGTLQTSFGSEGCSLFPMESSQRIYFVGLIETDSGEIFVGGGDHIFKLNTLGQRAEKFGQSGELVLDGRLAAMQLNAAGLSVLLRGKDSSSDVIWLRRIFP